MIQLPKPFPVWLQTRQDVQIGTWFWHTLRNRHRSQIYHLTRIYLRNSVWGVNLEIWKVTFLIYTKAGLFFVYKNKGRISRAVDHLNAQNWTSASALIRNSAPMLNLKSITNSPQGGRDTGDTI
jgi:hypothetical protein